MVARFATLTHFKVLGKKTVRVTFILKDGTHGTEQLRVEVADERHGDAVAPHEDTSDEHLRILVVREVVKRTRC